MQVCKYASMQAWEYASMQAWKYAIMKVRIQFKIFSSSYVSIQMESLV